MSTPPGAPHARGAGLPRAIVGIRGLPWGPFALAAVLVATSCSEPEAPAPKPPPTPAPEAGDSASPPVLQDGSEAEENAPTDWDRVVLEALAEEDVDTAPDSEPTDEHERADLAMVDFAFRRTVGRIVEASGIVEHRGGPAAVGVSVRLIIRKADGSLLTIREEDVSPSTLRAGDRGVFSASLVAEGAARCDTEILWTTPRATP